MTNALTLIIFKVFCFFKEQNLTYKLQNDLYKFLVVNVYSILTTKSTTYDLIR